MTTATAPRSATMTVRQHDGRTETAAPQAIGEAEVKAMVEAKAQEALEQALARPRQQVADPYLWWNLYAIGPIQPLAPNGPVAPHQVIKVGEPAFIATVLFLNPFPILPPAPGISPAQVLSNFALPYEVQYATGNLTTWSLGPANLNVVKPAAGMIPGVSFYVDVLGFVANQPGLYEMNITARILGAAPPYLNAPQFAGFARAVVDIDPDLFLEPAPGMQYDLPIRFQVYP